MQGVILNVLYLQEIIKQLTCVFELRPGGSAPHLGSSYGSTSITSSGGERGERGGVGGLLASANLTPGGSVSANTNSSLSVNVAEVHADLCWLVLQTWLEACRTGKLSSLLELLINVLLIISDNVDSSF